MIIELLSKYLCCAHCKIEKYHFMTEYSKQGNLCIKHISVEQ